jgi:hypothetical protein
MKKVMFVVLCLLIASACFALESGPSNKVGYTKITAGANGFTPFGIAFKTWQVPTGGIPTYGTPGNKPSDIIGDQAFCGTAANADRVISQGTGSAFAWRLTPSCVWQNTLETASGMTAAKAYWYRNFQVTARDIVIAGEADVTTLPPVVTIGAGTQAVPAYVPYFWRDPRSRSRDNLQLVVQGMHCGTAGTGDRVVDQTSGGGFAIRLCLSPFWFGTMLTVEPGRAYWIQNRGALYAYQYDPTSNATLSMPGSPKGDGGIMKIAPKTTVSKQANATN